MKPKRVLRVEVEWFDIEASAAWGDSEDKLPVCLTLGYVHSRPRKSQTIPFWKIKGSQAEEEPGGITNIPACCVLRMTYLGWAVVPWRKES